MVELEISIIPDSDTDKTTMQAFADEFGDTHNTKVNIRMMEWGTAWTELFSIAARGKGPDVSHIGSTWLSSLAMMNVLRPFHRDDIEPVGGISAFMNPSQQSIRLFNDDVIWAVPWTGYIYVVCYRNDFLSQAKAPNKPFANITTFRDTILKLRQAGFEIPWINSTVTPPYSDYVHTSASWIWGAGGNFLDRTGKHVVLDSPEAVAGIVAWLDTYLAIANDQKDMASDVAIKPFIEGQAAALLTDIRTANSFLATGIDETVSQNLVVTTLTSVPWCGGGSFVVWNHTRSQPQREKLALEFVQFMTSKKQNVRWAQQTGSMPARVDALEEIYPIGHPLRSVAMLTYRQGRAYPAVPVWRRIEYQIAQTLSDIVNSAHNDNTQNLPSLVRTGIAPLVRRLNLALEG